MEATFFTESASLTEAPPNLKTCITNFFIKLNNAVKLIGNKLKYVLT
jgi:hypothetical protein